MSNLQLWQAMRLKDLNEMVGNTEALSELRAVQSGFVMIHGPMGTGKTSTALAFVKQKTGIELQEHWTEHKHGFAYVRHCHASDFDIEQATNPHSFFYWKTPTYIIIDEAQELTLTRQQSRLKTIPPREDLTLILCTTDPQKIEASIKDRCAKVRLGQLSARELPTLVERACTARGIPYSLEIVRAMCRSEVFRPRQVFNVVDSLARGKSIEQACSEA